MKKISIILVAIIFLVACDISTNEPIRDVHTCKFPQELSERINHPHDFTWDCEWQAAHNDGDVILIYNSDSSRVTGLLKKSAY